jgi:hypothetical protein
VAFVTGNLKSDYHFIPAMRFLQNKIAIQTLLILACMFPPGSMQSDNMSTVLSDSGGSGSEFHQYLKQLPQYNPSFSGKTFADIPKGSDCEGRPKSAAGGSWKVRHLIIV